MGFAPLCLVGSQLKTVNPTIGVLFYGSLGNGETQLSVPFGGLGFAQ